MSEKMIKKCCIIFAVICLVMISCETKNGDKTEIPNSTATETPHSTAGTLPVEPATAPLAPPPDDDNGDNGDNLEEVTLTFSLESGFYDTGQVLTIEVTGDYPIYYTLDGGMPSASGTLYTEGIPMTCPASSENVFVVRAAAFSGKKMINRETTKTYILSANIKNRYSMPVISLVTDKKNLYDAKIGILEPSNVGKKGREWERPVNVTFFEPDGSIGFSQDAGIRLQGNVSRGIAQKSFRLTAKKEYGGDGKFKHEIFPGRRQIGGNNEIIKKYDRIILRGGANDSLMTGFQDERATMIRDELAQRIASVSGQPYQDFRPAVVYLNGQYYGMLNIREDYNQDYIEQHYNIPKDDVVVITNSYTRLDGGGIEFYYKVDDGFDEENKGSEYLADYALMQDYIIGHDMSDESHYSRASEMLDMENFYKYVAFEVYCCNTDWPHNNIAAWKSFGDKNADVKGQDGKWRYMYKDLDFAFARYDALSVAPEIYTRHDTDTIGDFVLDNPYDDQLKIGAMFRSLLENDGFRINFVNYICDIINEAMKPENAMRQVELIRSQIQPELLLHVNHWKPQIGQDTWSSLSPWDEAFETVYEFLKERPEAMLGHMAKIPELKLAENAFTMAGDGTIKARFAQN